MSSYRVVSTHQTGTTVELSVGYGSKIMKQTLFIENQPDDESFMDAIAAHTCELQIQKTIRDAQRKLQRAQAKAFRKSKMASAKIISRQHVQEVQANISVTTIQQKYHTAAQLVMNSGATFEHLVQQYCFLPDHQKQLLIQDQAQTEEIQREHEGLN